MKKLLVGCLFALMACGAFAAPTLVWDYGDTSIIDGFRAKCQDLSTSVVTEWETPAAQLQHDLGDYLAFGIIYKCWVTAYLGDQESPDSTHVHAVKSLCN